MMHPFRVCLPERETFVSEKNEFGVIGGFEVELEYSLHTISLWESKWKKPFISSSGKLTREEEYGLYDAMCLTPNVDIVMWGLLTPPLKKDIFEYMADSMSAYPKSSQKKGGHRERITTEVIYYWMSSLNIPYSCDRWHLNRLLKLIEVGFIKQTPQKKMSKRETAMRYRELNEQRKAMWNTKG